MIIFIVISSEDDFMNLLYKRSTVYRYLKDISKEGRTEVEVYLYLLPSSLFSLSIFKSVYGVCKFVSFSSNTRFTVRLLHKFSLFSTPNPIYRI